MPEEKSKAINQDQARALRAWNLIADSTDQVKGKDWEDKYGSLVKNFPAMIVTNGLGQALAFLKAKKKPHHLALYQHVSGWVTKSIYGGAESDQLLQKIIADSSTNYRRATTETLAFVAWLKRFAEAELKTEEGQS